MMKKLVFVTSIIIFVTKSFGACGYSEPIYLDFYELFIADKNRPQEHHAINEANVKAWKNYFKNYFDNVEEIVYSYSTDQVEGLLKKTRKKKIREALQYLKYAKEIQNVSSRFSKNSGSWDYYTILEQHDYNQEIYEKGVKGMEQAKSREIQLRYAYQIIRYLHYSKMYKEAIDFYINNIKKTDKNHEIYYYCLDQVSGCYYSLGDYPKAAYGFLRVYMNSGDRKVTALNSFRIHYKWDFEKLLELCETDTEKAYAKTLVTGTYYNIHDAEWVLNNAYNEEVLLSIYYYNDVYEQGRYFSMNKDNYPWMKWNDQENIEVDKNIGILQEIINHPKTQKTDFWYMSLAYLQHATGNYKEASETIQKIKNFNLINKNRYAFFNDLFKITQTGEVNDKIENNLHVFYQDKVASVRDAEFTTRKDLFYTFLKRYYYRNELNLKANLISISKGEADQIYDLEQLNDLKSLYEDKSKNKLEEFLLEKALGSNLNITHYVNEKKGSYFLMQNEFNEALSYFNKLPKNYTPHIVTGWDNGTNYQFDGYSNIPSQVFSTNIQEGFQFDMDLILTDKTYSTPQFSFINTKFSKKELTEYLIKLNQLANKGNSNANYLLGNYYYNTSELGYFRNLLIYYPENNFCSACHTHELLDEYNELSFNYYEKALNKTTNIEKQAKITYLMAKNVAYNRDEDPNMNKYYGLFHSLVNNYKNTSFYNEIIKECSQFNYYAFHVYPAKEGKRKRWGY